MTRRFAADENFNGRILRALRRRLGELDVVRVQDTELYGASDPAVLEWAAAQGQVLLTHDVATLVGYAHRRLKSGETMPGVLAVRADRPIGQIVADLELLILAGEPEDWVEQIIFLPL